MLISKELLFKKAILHLLMWFAIWLFFNSFFNAGSKNESFVFWFSVLLSGISISAIYVFIYYLIPDFLLEKSYRTFILYTIYALVFIICAVLMTMVFGFVFFFNLEYQQMPGLTKNPSVIVVAVLFMITAASSFKIVKFNFKAMEEKKRLENQFLQAQLKLKEEELSHLKSQIHPHFLFNTLNTLYGFSLQQSEQTPELILKLSALLDYILYQVDKETVFLKDELQHIYNYTDLEQIRFSDTLQLDFSIEEFSDDIRLPPMLLLPFVENAFKHGTVLQGSLFVEIRLKVTNNQLTFSVRNSYQNTSKASNSKGLGMQNLKKRLEYLYSDQFTLHVNQKENTYLTLLKIPINYG